MPAFGMGELLIILLIVIAIFGVSRLAGIGGALGQSVRDFRKTVRDDDTQDATKSGARQDQDRNAHLR